ACDEAFAHASLSLQGQMDCGGVHAVSVTIRHSSLLLNELVFVGVATVEVETRLWILNSSILKVSRWSWNWRFLFHNLEPWSKLLDSDLPFSGLCRGLFATETAYVASEQ